MFTQIIVGFACYVALFFMIFTSFISKSADFFAVLYLIDVGISLIPAIIAYKKGRDLLLWWFYGFLIFIVALIHSILIKPTDYVLLSQGMKKCPFCAELIRLDANVCRYCGRDLPREQSQAENFISL